LRLIMKILLSALLALAATAAPALAMTVTSPANGATVTSPFNLVASTTTCGGVPVVSMGYSIDNGSTVAAPIPINTMVSASTGAHVLKVKCWGKGTSGQVNVSITVGTSSPTGTSNITVANPANGAKTTSPFNLIASTTTCKGVPATSMGYSVDGGSIAAEPVSFSASISKNLGTHTLVVKCYGQGVSDQVSLSVDVVSPPTAATPAFSLASGTYTSKQVVGLSDATAGAVIHYTIDGSAPTTSSPVYSGPFTVSSSMVIEAMAAAPGYTNSGYGRASYTIAAPSQASIPSNAIAVKSIQTLPN
jgi:hypothetical protein